jgi:hypothetical protein
MLNVTVENMGELAVVECEGRIVQSEAAFKLVEAVTVPPQLEMEKAFVR